MTAILLFMRNPSTGSSPIATGLTVVCSMGNATADSLMTHGRRKPRVALSQLQTKWILRMQAHVSDASTPRAC
jgi:hypothetical protein